jgi:hypothetical protein
LSTNLSTNLSRRSRLGRHSGRGVWTRRKFANGTIFGPYAGVLVQDEKAAEASAYSWEIRRDGQSEWIDAGDPTRSNWMRFVNCPRHKVEENLVAFQWRGKIFYMTVRDIPADRELLVYYGDDYAETLGVTDVKERRQQQQLNQQWLDEAEVMKMGGDGRVCKICEKTFGTRGAMKTHIRQFHLGDRHHVCDMCGVRFSNLGHLEDHLRTHTGEKPFVCDVCDMSFTQSGHLTKHKRTH